VLILTQRKSALRITGLRAHGDLISVRLLLILILQILTDSDCGHKRCWLCLCLDFLLDDAYSGKYLEYGLQ